MKYYIAYGSNLNIEQMNRRCKDAKPVGADEIDNYKLVFRRGYLTIEPAEGFYVPVGVWEISDEDEKALDRYEGYPKFYRKEYIELPYYGKCLVYIMNDGFPEQAPTDGYFTTVYHGYTEFGLDKDPLMKAYDIIKWPC